MELKAGTPKPYSKTWGTKMMKTIQKHPNLIYEGIRGPYIYTRFRDYPQFTFAISYDSFQHKVVAQTRPRVKDEISYVGIKNIHSLSPDGLHRYLWDLVHNMVRTWTTKSFKLRK